MDNTDKIKRNIIIFTIFSISCYYFHCHIIGFINAKYEIHQCEYWDYCLYWNSAYTGCISIYQKYIWGICLESLSYKSAVKIKVTWFEIIFNCRFYLVDLAFALYYDISIWKWDTECSSGWKADIFCYWINNSYMLDGHVYRSF